MSRLNDHYGAFSRFVLGGAAVVSWYNAFSDNSNNLARIAKTADGGMLIWLMGLCGILVVLDVLMNDWSPDFFCVRGRSIRIAWKKAFEKRHYLFLGLAFCYGAQPFVADMSGRPVSLVVYFYFWAGVNVTIAFYDARERSRSLGWRKTYS